MMNTVEYIYTVRNKLGLTQVELANLLGVHWLTISNWEHGKSKPDPIRDGMLRAFYAAMQTVSPPSGTKERLASSGAYPTLLDLQKWADRICPTVITLAKQESNRSLLENLGAISPTSQEVAKASG